MECGEGNMECPKDAKQFKSEDISAIAWLEENDWGTPISWSTLNKTFRTLSPAFNLTH